MEVTCTHCGTKLNLPDDKIPKDQVVRINCPKCKNKITIDPQKSLTKGPSPDESIKETGKSSPEPTESGRKIEGPEGDAGYNDYSGDEALDFFDEGVKLALGMADDAVGEKIKAHVEELGYRYVSAPDIRDALGKLRFHHFDIIFLADGFDGQDLRNNPVMNYLNHMSMSSRRRIFVALMGDKFKTMDDLMAYALSADMVVNSKDVEKLSSLLKRGLSEHEKFYKVFMDTLVEAGKA